MDISDAITAKAFLEENWDAFLFYIKEHQYNDDATPEEEAQRIVQSLEDIYTS